MLRDALRWLQRGLQAAGHGLSTRVREDPMSSAAVVRLGLYAAVVFGLRWSSEQLVVGAAFVEGLTLWIARKTVTPNMDVPKGLPNVEVMDDD